MKTPLKFTALAGLLAASLTLATHSAQAAIIAYDGFEGYTLGDTVGQNGGSGDWTEAWRSYAATEDQQQVLGTGLSYNSGGIVIDGGSRSVQIVGPVGGTGFSAGTVLQRDFTSTNDTPIFIRFLMRMNSNTLDTGDFAGGFVANTDGPLAGIRNGGEGAGTLFARLTNSTAAANYVESGALSVNTTYLLMMKVERTTGNYNNLSFWVNPGADDEGDPDATATGGTGLVSSLGTFGLRVGTGQDADDLLVFDEVLVSDTWGGAIPEPTTVGLLLGAAGALILLRRRRG
jgi:hypothetical protein